MSFSPIVKKVTPAVVNIFTRSRVRVQQNISPFANDPFFQQFFAQNNIGGLTREQVVSSLGSGVIIKSDGLIVTSNHVIKGAQEIRVVLSDKREFEAKVAAQDPQSDLAFLRIAAKDLPFLEMRNSDTLEVGDLVLAIGNPFGVGQTVTSGIVSGLARKAAGVSDYQFFIQTDAAINPGNSGGALVDMKGHLIGINTAIYSKSGGSMGIGFAIPSNMIRSLTEGKLQGSRIVRPWLGVAVQPVTSEIAEAMGMKTPQGVIIKNVYPGSPAEKGGLKAGDVLVAVAGVPINGEDDMNYRLALSKLGEATPFSIQRKGASMDLTVVMAEPPENPKRDARLIKGRNPLEGVTVANLSPALANEIGIDDMIAGVVVVKPATQGLGVNVGMMPGDIILEINGVKITSTTQLESLLQKTTGEWRIAFARGKIITTLTVRM